MKAFEVTIKGVAPILMHRFDEQAAAEVEGEVKGAKQDHGTAEEQAERAAYRIDGEGSELFIPAECVYQALVKAASGFKVKGGRGKTYKDPAKGAVNVRPDFIGLGVNEYDIDRRRARVQQRACMRYRPRLDEWGCSFVIEVLDDELIPEEVVKAILDRAGQQVGLLDYRPRFGRFMVTEWKAV